MKPEVSNGPGYDLDLETAFEQSLRNGKAAENALLQILAQRGGLRVEVKNETAKCPDTGNLFIEIAQSDGNGGKKRSGINITTANWWFIWFTPESGIWVTPGALKQFCREHGITTPGGDNGNVAKLIKLRDFVQWLLNKWKTV